MVFTGLAPYPPQNLIECNMFLLVSPVQTHLNMKHLQTHITRTLEELKGRRPWIQVFGKLWVHDFVCHDSRSALKDNACAAVVINYPLCSVPQEPERSINLISKVPTQCLVLLAP